jgi:hypothetical protein
MKIIIFTSLLLTSSLNAGIIDDAKGLIGRVGQGREYGNDIGPCEITIQDGYLKLVGDYYFSSWIELSAKQIKKSLKETIYLSSETGNRPGGDKCGDQGGMIKYRKSAIINHDISRVSITESFRCILDGFQKYSIEYSCQL